MAQGVYQGGQEKPSSPSPGSSSQVSTGTGNIEPFDTEPKYDDIPPPSSSAPRRVLESFKRDPSKRATPKGAIGANGKVYDVEAAAVATASSPLARKLKGRHLQMIAIGGSIGMPRSRCNAFQC